MGDNSSVDESDWDDDGWWEYGDCPKCKTYAIFNLTDDDSNDNDLVMECASCGNKTPYSKITDDSAVLEAAREWEKSDKDIDDFMDYVMSKESDPAEATWWSSESKSKGSKWGSSKGSYSWCQHVRKPFPLEEGLTIYASASRDRPKSYEDVQPVTLAVYLDASWVAGMPMVTSGLTLPWAPESTPAVFFPWKDYGVPELDPALELITWTLEQLRAGEVIETGCMGGHGRTGTFLACLLAAQGVKPGSAVERVKTKHCKSAIETEEQVGFVADVYEALHDSEGVWWKEGGPDPEHGDPKANPEFALYLKWFEAERSSYTYKSAFKKEEKKQGKSTPPPGTYKETYKKK